MAQIFFPNISWLRWQRKRQRFLRFTTLNGTELEFKSLTVTSFKFAKRLECKRTGICLADSIPILSPRQKVFSHWGINWTSFFTLRQHNLNFFDNFRMRYGFVSHWALQGRDHKLGMQWVCKKVWDTYTQFLPSDHS